MRKSSSDIFDLIHSLTRVEKGYFIKYALSTTQGRRNNSILIFEEINKQKTYNEKAIIDKFKGFGFTKQFPVAKNFLYRQLLHAMELYRNDVHIELKSLLNAIQFLFEKELYQQGHKVIIKAKQLAEKHELFWVLLEIYRRWEITLAINTVDKAWVDRIISEEKELMEKLQNSKRYRDLDLTSVSYFMNSGIVRTTTASAFKKMDRILNTRHLKDESHATTFESKLRFHNTHIFNFSSKQDFPNLYKHAKKIDSLYELHPHQAENNPRPYVANINNVAAACCEMKKYDEMKIYIDKLETIYTSVKQVRQNTNLFYLLSSNKLLLLHKTGYFNEAVSEVKKIISQFDKHKLRINDYQKQMLLLNIAISYFNIGDYKNSVYWFNRIINDATLPLRQDVESCIKILYLINHYELRNRELLPYLIRSTYRFFKKKKRLYKFETLVINFFRNDVAFNDTGKKLFQAFKKLRDIMCLLLEDKHEKGVFLHFDYISWLDSKVENRPFSQIVKEKAMREAVK